MSDTPAWLILAPAAASTIVSCVALWIQAKTNSRALAENSRRAAVDRRQQRIEKIYLKVIEALRQNEDVVFLAMTASHDSDADVADRAKLWIDGPLVELPAELVAFASDEVERLTGEMQAQLATLAMASLTANTRLEEAKALGLAPADHPPVGPAAAEIRAAYGSFVTVVDKLVKQMRTELWEM